MIFICCCCVHINIVKMAKSWRGDSFRSRFSTCFSFKQNVYLRFWFQIQINVTLSSFEFLSRVPFSQCYSYFLNALSTSKYKIQTLPMIVIHGLEKPIKQTMLFQFIYAILSQNDNHFRIPICTFQKIVHLFTTKIIQMKPNQER